MKHSSVLSWQMILPFKCMWCKVVPVHTVEVIVFQFVFLTVRIFFPKHPLDTHLLTETIKHIQIQYNKHNGWLQMIQWSICGSRVLFRDTSVVVWWTEKSFILTLYSVQGRTGSVVAFIRSCSLKGAVKNAETEILKIRVRGHLQGNFLGVRQVTLRWEDLQGMTNFH